MTSAQTMLVRARSWGAVLALAALFAAALALPAGCTGPSKRDKELTEPRLTTAPYDARSGELLWAVIPLANESGTEAVDPLRVSDQLVAAVEEIEGVRSVPLNRTLQALQSLEMRGVRTPAQVNQLAVAMGVDGIIIGTITAYDPYDPPTIGMNLALYARSDAMHSRAPIETIDSRDLTAAPTDTAIPQQPGLADQPAAVVSANLDAKNHAVLAALRDWAEGRHDPVSALGWKRYTASMDLYTQFATQHLVAALIDQEQHRLASLHETEETPEH